MSVTLAQGVCLAQARKDRNWPGRAVWLLARHCIHHAGHACCVRLQVSFSAGQLVWQERDSTNSQFFIIREGTASLKDAATGAVTSKLGPGKYFGQQSLVGAGGRGGHRTPLQRRSHALHQA